MKRLYRLTIVLAIFALSGCSSAEKTANDSKKPDARIKPTITVPPPPEFYEGTPHWELQSRQWPSFMEWTLDSAGECTYDSLNLRLSGEGLQNLLAGPRSPERPLMCWITLTVRPIPKRLISYSFILDSVVFFDPITQRHLPALPMLSVERYTQKGVVRTRFGNNAARPVNPDLQENQELVPTLYITSVEKKTIKVTMAPIKIPFVREIKPDLVPTDSLKWGPS